MPVRISLGFAIAEQDVPVDFQTIYDMAAAAEAEAKKTGRNRCVCKNVLKLPFEQAG